MTEPRVPALCAWCKARLPWPITGCMQWRTYHDGVHTIGPNYIQCPECGQKYALPEAPCSPRATSSQ